MIDFALYKSKRLNVHFDFWQSETFISSRDQQRMDNLLTEANVSDSIPVSFKPKTLKWILQQLRYFTLFIKHGNVDPPHPPR